jgi:hypothetical protein
MNVQAIRELRARCDASLSDCREALRATGDDVDAALAWLRANGRLPPEPEPVAPLADELREAANNYDDFRELYRKLMASGGDVSVLVAPFARLDEASQAEVLGMIEAGIAARRVGPLRAYRALGREVTAELVRGALGPGSTEPVEPFFDELLRGGALAPEVLALLAGRAQRYGGAPELPERIRWLLTSPQPALRELGVEWREEWRAAAAAGEDPGPLVEDLSFPLASASAAFMQALAIARSTADEAPAELNRLARRWRETERVWLEWELVEQVLAGREWAREPLAWVAGGLARRLFGIERKMPPRPEPELADLVLTAARPLQAADRERLAAGDELERALHVAMNRGELAPFYQALAGRFGLAPEQLGVGFREYVEATLEVAAVEGPLAIDGIAAALRTPMRLDRVVADGSLGDGPVPAIRVGGDGEADFWLPLVGRAERLRTLDRAELVAQAAGFRQYPAIYPDPPAAFVKWFTEVDRGFGIEGLIRLQLALSRRAPSAPLLRELVAKHSDWTDASEWTEPALAFARRLAERPAS